MENRSLEEGVLLGSRRDLIPGFSLILLLSVLLVATLQFRFGPDPTNSALAARTLSTQSGLQITDLTFGSGDAVIIGDVIAIHYTGYLSDDTQFDSSYDRGQPFVFRVGVGRVIPGIDEGLTGMEAGGSRRLIIPPDMAYGEQGVGGVIPPNETLRFEVELLEIYRVQTEQLVEGTGEPSVIGDQVTLEYTVWLEDGQQLDSSAQSGPLVFLLGGGSILPGLDQGVTGMRLGEKRLITLPPELAFGAQGQGPVPPNATLIFEVELTSVQ